MNFDGMFLLSHRKKEMTSTGGAGDEVDFFEKFVFMRFPIIISFICSLQTFI